VTPMVIADRTSRARGAKSARCTAADPLRPYWEQSRSAPRVGGQ
jgi:hypothetical protein